MRRHAKEREFVDRDKPFLGRYRVQHEARLELQLLHQGAGGFLAHGPLRPLALLVEEQLHQCPL